MWALLDEAVADLLEEPDGALVVALDFGDDLRPAIDGHCKKFNSLHDLLGQPLAPELGQRDHDIDLGLVRLDPLREEQVHIADHSLLAVLDTALLVEDYEGVLLVVLQPAAMVLQLLL